MIEYALAPLAILASAWFCSRRPAAAVITVFALSGCYGSLNAFTGLSGALFADVLMVGLWLGLLVSFLVGRRAGLGVLWPAHVALALFLGLTLLAMVSSPDVTKAFLSFRLSGWYVFAAILLAYAGWSLATYTRIARGFVVVGLLVGGYALFRWLVGPAEAETTRALEVAGGYNFVEGELRTFGSFNAGHQLGFWAAVVAPFCLAAGLGWRGRWRVVAYAGFLVCAFAVLASEVRGGFVGLVIGCGAALALYQLARSMPGFKAGRTAVIGLGCVAVIAAALLVTAGSNSKLTRYTNIFNREQDISYVHREMKWEEALEDVREHPFGQGIGSGSLNESFREPYSTPASLALDNSFLKIAYEQGFAVMVLFVGVMVLLVFQLALGAIRAMSTEAAAMGIGATGGLVAALVVFYTGMEYEDVIALAPWMLAGLGAGVLIRDQAERAAAARRRAREASVRINRRPVPRPPASSPDRTLVPS